MKDFALNRQNGFINFSTMTLLVGGLALGGLLLYGSTSGQELPLWPAIAVSLVNVVAAAKIVIDTRKARRQAQTESDDARKTNRPRRKPR
jgi:hypothetical protein